MSSLKDYFNDGFYPDDYSGGEQTFKCLPPGKYEVLIESAEVCQTKKGNGHIVKTELTVLGPAHGGRKLWDNILFQHPNPEAAGIGLKRLGSLGRAAGLSCIDDTAELHNKSVIAHVTVKGDSNEINGYSSPGRAEKAVARPTANSCFPEQTTDEDCPF